MTNNSWEDPDFPISEVQQHCDHVTKFVKTNKISRYQWGNQKP